MLKIKTKHKETKPNQWLAGLHAVEIDGRRELRNNSNHTVTVHSSGPYATFTNETESFALWISIVQYLTAKALLEAN
jgi:hypothetical protein